jgi:CRISPR-associated endoribonuclease Cas6
MNNRPPEKPELLALVLTLRPLPDENENRSTTAPFWWGDAAHQLFLDGISRVSPDLAAELHQKNIQHPFNVSTLQGRFPERQLDPSDTYELRFTALSRATAAALLDCTAPGGAFAVGSPVKLDYRPFQVEKVALDGAAHPMAGMTDYQGMAAGAMLGLTPAPQRVMLAFTSPTNFASNGKLSTNKQHIAHPLPDLVFGSLLDRWNQFAPIAFPNELRIYLQECLLLTHFELRSRSVSISGGQQIGMLGRATFKTRNYDRYWMSLVSALADFAFFAGIGAKTAAGMGQAHRVYPEVVAEDAEEEKP